MVFCKHGSQPEVQPLGYQTFHDTFETGQNSRIRPANPRTKTYRNGILQLAPMRIEPIAMALA